MVVAELAAAIPAFVVVLVLALSAVRLGIDQVRCVDAARVGARAAARGDGPGAVESVSSRIAPPGASVSIRAGPGEVTVEVTVSRALGAWRGFAVRASSTAPTEQP